MLSAIAAVTEWPKDLITTRFWIISTYVLLLSRAMTKFQLSQIYRFCVSDGVPRRSFIVALIVGTILNLINQGDALFGDGHLNLTKIILTYAVPYCVATFGAVSYRLSLSPNVRRRPTQQN